MSSGIPSPRQDFLREVNRADELVDVARAALCVAREEYPQLPAAHYLLRLDQLAEDVKDRLAEDSPSLIVLHEVIDTVYARNGFHGNTEAYYDPRNSYLSDVLDRRKGIPLTLGIVLLEVGWRLGLPLEGVDFPGHFLVRYAGEEIRLLIDPFDAGRIRFEADAQELLDRAYGGMVRLHPRFLRTARRREIVARLLANLKGIYVTTEDHGRALAAVERILLIHPTAGSEMRDRGRLLARMGRTGEALEQLEWYLEALPRASDADRIRALVDELRGGRERG